MKRIQVIAEFFRRRGAGGEFALLLALAALALLVAPSYPMVYGAGAVVAVLVMEAPFLNFRESSPSRTERRKPGPRAHRVAGDPWTGPHKTRKRRWGKRGIAGMERYAERGSILRGR